MKKWNERNSKKFEMQKLILTYMSNYCLKNLVISSFFFNIFSMSAFEKLIWTESKSCYKNMRANLILNLPIWVPGSVRDNKLF